MQETTLWPSLILLRSSIMRLNLCQGHPPSRSGIMLICQLRPRYYRFLKSIQTLNINWTESTLISQLQPTTLRDHCLPFIVIFLLSLSFKLAQMFKGLSGNLRPCICVQYHVPLIEVFGGPLVPLWRHIFAE